MAVAVTLCSLVGANSLMRTSVCRFPLHQVRPTELERLPFYSSGRKTQSKAVKLLLDHAWFKFRPVSMRVTQVQPPISESHDQRNMRLKRPMSPHLLIYKPQLTSMLSITHRMTGLALSVYALGFAAFSLSPGSFPHMVEAMQSMHIAAPVIFTSKLILSLPVAYHLCNGIRHLVWDFGKALTIKDVYTTGYILCGATAVLTVIFAAM